MGGSKSSDLLAPSRVGVRRFVVVGLAVVVVLAGIMSYYASASPDGLEKVAADQGMDAAAIDSATAGSPFAEYSVTAIDDQRLSGGVAGIVGVGLTFAVAGGGVLMMRRQGRTAS